MLCCYIGRITLYLFLCNQQQIQKSRNPKTKFDFLMKSSDTQESSLREAIADVLNVSRDVF